MERTLEPEVMDTLEAAQAYDCMDHGEANRAFVRRLVALGAAGRMLDVGTGPGTIPLLICAEIADCQVVGIDLSRHMLDCAEQHRRGSEFAARVEYAVEDAKQLSYQDGAFDAVFSNTILHHIPEPGALLAEAARVLRPDGVLLVRDLYRPHSAARADELVAQHAADCTEEQKGLFRDSLHAALTPGELRVLADKVGLAHARLVVDTDRHMSLQWNPAVG